MIDQLLFSIDQFGQCPSLLINRKDRFHSRYGGITTIILYLVSLVAFAFFSQELFKRESPSVNLSTESINHPGLIDYFDNFEVIIGLQNPSYVVEINKKIFTAKGFLFKTSVNSSGSFSVRTEVNLTSCDVAMKDSVNYDLIKHYRLEGFYCFSKEQSQVNASDLGVNEFWGNDGFKMLQIKFYDCKNTSDDSSCASEEEIEKFLNLTTMSVYYTDNYIRTRNYHSPFERGVKEAFFYVSKNYLTSITEYIMHLNVYSDDGLLFTTNNTKSSFMENKIEEFTINPRTSDNFVSFSIQLSNLGQMYYRKYYKLQDLAAQVGGIFKTLFFVVFVFNTFYSENQYFEFVLNKFYESPHPIKRLSHRTDQNKTEERLATSSPRKSPEKKKPVQKHGLHLTFFDKLFVITFCPKISNANKKKKLKDFLAGKAIICDYLEVENVIKKFYYFERLVDVTLSKEEGNNFYIQFRPHFIKGMPMHEKHRLFEEKQKEETSKNTNGKNMRKKNHRSDFNHERNQIEDVGSKETSQKF